VKIAKQEREGGQQRDGAAAQPVKLDRDLAVRAAGEPLLSAARRDGNRRRRRRCRAARAAPW